MGCCVSLCGVQKKINLTWTKMEKAYYIHIFTRKHVVSHQPQIGISARSLQATQESETIAVPCSRHSFNV